ncbi:ETX/MTX2 family pore-forming toxin [Corallococcus carmarthensis]|uniref:ETX/MTX2 family pore-forming toxin n=1 Tax=Corallococcus carmarthensis TaxID=2316728 RepID=UPI0013157ED1|nr:ETX/MTX2 family pore-forming toxin [Corallococcus carmarthensis]NOK16531.1 ETX/MTX2 family pore-forming toxin [Corallococcus carmarthensis]
MSGVFYLVLPQTHERNARMPAISKLPAPGPTPPNQPSNTVRLFQDASWTSASYAFNVNDYAKDKRQSISGTNMQDRATWIAFNLPVGTVVTMTDNFVAPADGNVFNLKGCGRVVDLVGTGQTEAVALSQVNMNDCISAWFWHTPDLNLGGVELYQDADFKGNRTVLFLSEWNARQLHSLSGWYIHDSASSARWPSLYDAQTVSLFANADGSGVSYENIKAWGSFSQLSSFKEVGFNDALSSFSWNNLIPKQEIIAPVIVTVPNSGGQSLSTHLTATNNSPEVQPQTITLTNTTEQTTSVTVTNQYTAGMELGYSLSAKAGIGVGEVTQEWTLKLTFTYSRTESSTLTKTQTTALSISQVFNVPPYSIAQATLWVQMGLLPPNTTYRTTAERWYDADLKGSTYDPANGWWRRTEFITLQMGGTLAVNSNLVVETSPIPQATEA